MLPICYQNHSKYAITVLYNLQSKDNEELLWKLQAVIQDKSSITINTIQANQVIKARDEIVGRLNDDERREVVTRIREITGKSDSN